MTNEYQQGHQWAHSQQQQQKSDPWNFMNPGSGTYQHRGNDHRQHQNAGWADPWVWAASMLGVPENASPDQIRAAWRNAARVHHPDMGGDPARFGMIRRAYEVMLQPRMAPAEPSAASQQRGYGTTPSAPGLTRWQPGRTQWDAPAERWIYQGWATVEVVPPAPRPFWWAMALVPTVAAVLIVVVVIVFGAGAVAVAFAVVVGVEVTTFGIWSAAGRPPLWRRSYRQSQRDQQRKRQEPARWEYPTGPAQTGGTSR